MIYIYILYNNTYDFKNTHLLPQHFCKNVANMEYICMFNIYIYILFYICHPTTYAPLKDYCHNWHFPSL